MASSPPSATEKLEQDVLDSDAAGRATIRGGSLRTAGYFVGMLLSVVAVPLMIRHLGTTQYGSYVKVISLVTLVQGITDIGLQQFGARAWVQRTGEDRTRLMGNLLAMRTVLTVIGVTAATGFAALAGYGGVAVVGAAFVGAGVITTVIQGTFAVPLEAELRLGLITTIEFLRQLFSVIAIVALVLLGGDLLAFWAVAAPVGVLILALTYALVPRARTLRPQFDRAEWAGLLRSLLPFATATVIASVYLQITVILTSLLTTKAQLGYYATSFRVLQVLAALPPLTVGAALPVLARAARDDHARLEYVLQRLFDVTLIFGAWLALVIWLGAGFAMQILTGSSNGPPTAVLQIQGPAIGVSFVGACWVYGLFALHRHRALLTTTLCSLAVNVPLLLVLVPPLGARGAAIAFTAGEVTVSLSALLLLLHHHRSLRLSPRVPLRVLAAVAPGIAIAFVPGVSSFERAAIASVLYLAVLLVTRAIPVELVDAMRRGARQA
jgi:O-antigen/teichoic acid export membrane protein